MNCAHSPIAITIATPAKTVVAVSVELVSVASGTASRPIANNALVAARACVRRIRLTTRVAGICATTMKKVLMKMMAPISPGRTGVCAFANGARMLEKERAAGHHEHDVGGAQDEEEPIVSNCSEARSTVARRPSLR